MQNTAFTEHWIREGKLNDKVNGMKYNVKNWRYKNTDQEPMKFKQLKLLMIIFRNTGNP